MVIIIFIVRNFIHEHKVAVVVTLRVAEALKSDVGNGKARIGNIIRKKMKVAERRKEKNVSCSRRRV